ncbi:c-type cytochrome [Arenimonas sp.]|uniref:c-type cytochrome n=1 Tax=Arenimonas sp. TaxID=1872635 RepID=UPI0035B1B728
MSRSILMVLLATLLSPALAHAAEPRPIPKLAPEEAAAAEADYQRYCALCHGPDRAGHANDHAPSLKSDSLLRTAFPWLLRESIAYGRPGTPMGGYLDEIGGPMSLDEVRRMVLWLHEQGGSPEPIRVGSDRVAGNAEAGAGVYAQHCASCHGDEGEGVTATALGNPAMLATTPDNFLRYAIEHGRDGTPMESFAGTLSPTQMDDVTAFLRSRATGWNSDPRPLVPPPALADAVLNPEAAAPEFEFKNGHYITAADLDRILKEKRRLVLLDTRVASMWQIAHIEGAVPIPYYSNPGEVISALPRDGTWIISYCECPRAAADSVNKFLREEGFTNTAVLWEGIGGWVALGYPTAVGRADK